MTPNGNILIVDGYGQIYRSFYAIRGLTNPHGEPINALYGVARFLLALDRDQPHEFGAVALDKGRPTERLEILPTYKATRPPMPDDLRSQLEPIRQWIDAAGWPILQQQGIEADDLIAAVVTAREGHQTYIVSHDKDLGQLVDQTGVFQLVPGNKGSLLKLGPDGVQEKFGVHPRHIRDFLALVGDNVDNIPGVAGIGPKTAATLINQHGSINAMLETPDAIENPKLRAKIIAGADNLQRNLKLVTLSTQLPDGWQGLETIRRRPPDWDRMTDIARHNGFKSIITTLEKVRSDARSPMLF